MEAASSPRFSVVAAVIENGGRFLLARRAAHKSSAGWWEFPGGKVEAGESPQDALARELLEEMALVAEVVGQAVHHMEERGCTFSAFRVRILEGQPSLRDHDEIRWLTAHEIRHYRMHRFDQEVAVRLTHR